MKIANRIGAKLLTSYFSLLPILFVIIGFLENQKTYATGVDSLSNFLPIEIEGELSNLQNDANLSVTTVKHVPLNFTVVLSKAEADPVFSTLFQFQRLLRGPPLDLLMQLF